ncbi:diguanylate cyclase [Niveibacterium sp. SC-1]|uniref:diguanylate cyclase n=1 Tax=Niveibacterium sp. SC-1 TaxID=3135646 RepID=UPI00311D2DA7
MYPPLDFARFEQLKTTGDLPSPQGVAMAIMRATQAEDVSMAELGHIIRSDPAFSGRLIKAANGLQGYGRRAVASVQDALLILGLPAVRNLALGFSLLGRYRGGACAAFDYEHYWSGSVLCAVAMQKLAQRTRVAPADEAYCIGLLARVGELALATLFPAEFGALLGSVAAGDAESLARAEQEAFAMTHRELGGAMLADWGVPRVFAEAVVRHEVPVLLEEGAGREQTLVVALNLARAIAELCSASREDRIARLPALQEKARALRIEPQDLHELCDEAARDWLEWGVLLQLPTANLESFATLSAARPAVVPADEPDQGATAGRDARLRILVADADAEVRRAVRAVLEDAGHEVQEAANAQDAVDMAMMVQPHMMIVDWGAEEDRGLKVVQHLRQTRPGRSIYVLLLTGHENEQRLVEAFECGVDDFMTKPVNPRVLLARMRAALRVVKLHEEIERDREEIRHVAAELAVSNRRLQEVALSDPLTGFPNRRYLEERLLAEWASSLRNERPLAVLLVDVDEFKLINDTYGHDVGDAVLKSAALSIKNGLRSHDVIARTGSDEFVVICPDTSMAGAEHMANRIRSLVEQSTVTSGRLQLRVTVSVGVATRELGVSTPELLLKHADQALHASKKAGRNRVSSIQERHVSEVGSAVRH